MSTCFGTLPVSGSWAGSVTTPELDGYDQIVFVAAASNVDTDGSLQLPYHTIAEGLSEAAGRSPTASNKICVYVFSGNYNESGLTMTAHVHLQGANTETVVISNASNILTSSVDNVSVSGITFEATSTNSLVTINGTSMTDYTDITHCKFVGNGSNNNVIDVINGGLVKFYDCTFEGENVGDRILETDTDTDNDCRLYKTSVLGDILHAGGNLELTDVTANSGVSCTGSSSLNITDSFIRNSVDHCVELGTTGDILLHQSTFISPGYVNPDNFHCINATVDPGANEWIGNTFRHDGTAPDYSVYSSVSFSFTGHGNNFEEGYNSNCTDALAVKGTPANNDIVIIEDSADDFKPKRATLSSLPGGGGGASALSQLTIDTDKDWQGYSISNIDELDITGALTIPSNATAVNTGDIRYNTTAVALEYYDGAEWHDAGSPALVSSSDSTVAEGNNSLTGLKDKFLIKQIIITTTSTDWTLTLYSKDDYLSDELIVLKNRNSDVIYSPDITYEDKDATAELHYNFTDDSGAATHDIELYGTSLR